MTASGLGGLGSQREVGVRLRASRKEKQIQGKRIDLPRGCTDTGEGALEDPTYPAFAGPSFSEEYTASCILQPRWNHPGWSYCYMLVVYIYFCSDFTSS